MPTGIPKDDTRIVTGKKVECFTCSQLITRWDGLKQRPSTGQLEDKKVGSFVEFILIGNLSCYTMQLSRIDVLLRENPLSPPGRAHCSCASKHFASGPRRSHQKCTYFYNSTFHFWAFSMSPGLT
jgi:hypothetical protein